MVVNTAQMRYHDVPCRLWTAHFSDPSGKDEALCHRTVQEAACMITEDHPMPRKSRIDAGCEERGAPSTTSWSGRWAYNQNVFCPR
jgi:hypothetical protein